jgi:cytidine deaminase
MSNKQVVTSDSKLIKAAMEVRSHSYAPYSKFTVGAALLTKSGRIFSGCNVENISFGLTICAERVALGAAVSNGEKEIVAIYLAADSKQPVLPCGACRQVLAEFNPSMKIVTSTISGERETVKLKDLLPRHDQGILESFHDV